jgi:hypothetical protein
MITLFFLIPAVAFAVAVALHTTQRRGSMRPWRRRTSTPPIQDFKPLPPGEVGWTALDDRQLVRLLTDSAK